MEAFLAAAAPAAGWIVAAFAFPVGAIIGARLACGRVAPVFRRLERLEDFLLPRQKRRFQNEDDFDGHEYEAPSPFEERLNERSRSDGRGMVTVRQRLLSEVPCKDPVLRKELMALRERGDGKWLGMLVDRAYSHPDRARELASLRSRYAAKGWELTSVEPAYDSGEGLFVWIELERRVSMTGRSRTAA